MLESLVIGVERDPFQTYQAEEENAVYQTVEGSDPTLVESAKTAVNRMQKAMEKLETLATGSEEVLCLLYLSKSVGPETVDAREQMTDQREKVSVIADHPQPHGVKVDHKDRKMADRAHQGENSKIDLLLIGRLQLLSKTANGAPRCDLMHQPPSLQSHPAMEARLLHLQLSLQQHQQPDPS